MKHSTMRNLAIGALVGLLATGVSAQQYRGDWWGHGHMGSGHMGSGGMHGWGWGQMNPGQQQRMQRHWTYMNQGVPGAYRGARSTVRATPQVIAGRSLEPSPALLRQFVQMPMSGDEYLLWTISEGGERFGTDMPAFEDKLGEEDIWKIIAYMRAGFP